MRRMYCALIGRLLIASASIASAQAMQNEPADFRGIPWGAEHNQFQADLSVLRDEGEVVYYKRNADVLKINQVDALKVAYRFYKNRFSAGVIQTYGGPNQKALLETLTSMHGKPLRPRPRVQQYFWDGELAYISLTCEVTSYCAVEFVGKALMQQEQADTGLAPTVGNEKRDDD